ncbi:hypothetical protein K3495_g766 [Podosphaera aphanis]|nr:hypothetical protein K3495_g766 [Podosphaera aphanis]
MDAAEIVSPTHQAFNPDGSSTTEKTQHLNNFTYTLTACCRCRERKTRCDPTLPRCLPCERGDAVCEYFDRVKKKKIPRSYVIQLQERIQALEKELSQYTKDEPLPDTEDIVRPGNLVRLNSYEETPRFLGPSSGIAITRLVMEEAKKYTGSGTIRELVPEVRVRRSPKAGLARKRNKDSYPTISALPAQNLPSFSVTKKLADVYNQKAQYLLPTLHEPTFISDMQDVYNGSHDPYKNFIVRMVLAISLQKLDRTYAGLADSYYLAAMERLEEVIHPKDLKTLQCLVLIAQYSLLTPIRTAIYYIVGLATKLCQQLGLSEEKTILQGLTPDRFDPLQIDMRRRLSWIVLSLEFGLAHSMGRPNAYAPGKDHIDVELFQSIDDKYITANGILPGPISEKKTVAIHFMRMRLLQAEIRRVLYQTKRPEPNNEDHHWYREIQEKMRNWVDSSPQSPDWSKPWFYGRYRTMILMLFRPSPQVPQPMTRSAIICYDAASANIQSLSKQMSTAMVDITWVFMLTLFQAMNIILWTISYPEIRALHSKIDVEKNIEIAIETMHQCQDRWPGTTAAIHLYSRLAEACLKSYDNKESPTSASFRLSEKNGSSHLNLSAPLPNTSPLLKSCVSVDAQTSFSSLDNQLRSKAPNASNTIAYDLFPAKESFQPDPMPEVNCFEQHYQFNNNPSENLQYSIFTNPPPPTQFENEGNILNSVYFMQPISYSFGESLNLDHDLNVDMSFDSLSQQQQSELIHTLETNGPYDIQNLMNFSPGLE